MRSKYREAQILHALDEISKDKEASKKLWNDICKVTAEHIRSWLERNERPHHRVEGIIIEKNGYLRMLCPKCKSVHPATVTFCGQCGVQLQDTWLKKNPEEEPHGIGITNQHPENMNLMTPHYICIPCPAPGFLMVMVNDRFESTNSRLRTPKLT